MRVHNETLFVNILETPVSMRERIMNGRHAEERPSLEIYAPAYLPGYEHDTPANKFYNGKIHYEMFARFLHGQIGNNWNDVYAEIISRIPTKQFDYAEMICWFVADKVEFVDGRPWNKKSQQFIWMGEAIEPVIRGCKWDWPEFIEFYVHPQTNKLVHVPQKA